MQSSREKTESRAARGLCVGCGQRPPMEGKRVCQECSRKATEQRRKGRQDRAARGICGECGKRAAQPGKKLCAVCNARYLRAQRELREARRRAGRCPKCGGEVTDKHKLCASCREQNRARLEKWKQKREAGK